ncbi:F-box/LRR-repeat protein 17 [Capsicum chinense]|nr:F-box/LRR-repeat protein 17 [Capsicum chinense]
MLKRLPPSSLLSSAKVCKGWRDVSRRIWRSAEELRLGVPVNAQIGLVGSVLKKCPGLVKISLRMKSDVDATMLACISFSCPNSDSLEIFTSDTSVNRITGDELGRFVADKRCLTNLKMEGCSNLGGFTLSSTSLSTLHLSDLFCYSKMVLHCPNLKEISLNFSRQENDSTDLTATVEGLGRSCPRLQNIHVASVRQTHAVVLALTAANLRGLRMLSLVLGSEITDASVAAIASSYSMLELLDLSGSSVSDSGIGMICNVFPETLSKLLLALCPNITSNLDSQTTQENDNGELQRTPSSKLHLIYQKLIIKHSRLKKLSLWGCSSLDSLYLNCPELNDLNLNSCMNLNPERLLLQCPNLESVHASGCSDTLVETLQNQVNQHISLAFRLCFSSVSSFWPGGHLFHVVQDCQLGLVSGDFMAEGNHFPCKRLPDGSKRIRVLHLYNPQVKMRAMLTQMDLDDALLGFEKMPSSWMDEDKRHKDWKALSQIHFHLSNQILQDVLKETTVVALWLKLESLCMTKILTSKLYLKQRFYSHRMSEGASLEDHLFVFKEIVSDLEILEVKYD